MSTATARSDESEADISNEVRRRRPDKSERAASFTAVYHAEADAMLRLAVLLTGQPDAARDIVQDAFLGLHRRWHKVDNPGAYLRRSVVNGTKSFHRRLGRRREIPLGHHAEDGSIAPVELEIDETYRMLNQLNRRQRAVVVLKFYEGRSESEIAEIVGCRPGSVGPTVQRALAKLRDAHAYINPETSTTPHTTTPTPQTTQGNES